jgi:hypothetical protein
MELAYAKRHHIPVFGWAPNFALALPKNSPPTKANLYPGRHPGPWLIAHVTKFFPNLKDACEELRNV